MTFPFEVSFDGVQSNLVELIRFCGRPTLCRDPRASPHPESQRRPVPIAERGPATSTTTAELTASPPSRVPPRIRMRSPVRYPPPFAPLVAQDEVHRAAALDGGSAHRGDQLGEPGEPLRRALVDEAGRVAHHPGGLSLGVPELEVALAGRDLFASNRYRAATGELRPRSRSPRRLRKGRGFLDLHPGLPAMDLIHGLESKGAHPPPKPASDQPPVSAAARHVPARARTLGLAPGPEETPSVRSGPAGAGSVGVGSVRQTGTPVPVGSAGGQGRGRRPRRQGSSGRPPAATTDRGATLRPW